MRPKISLTDSVLSHPSLITSTNNTLKTKLKSGLKT